VIFTSKKITNRNSIQSSFKLQEGILISITKDFRSPNKMLKYNLALNKELPASKILLMQEINKGKTSNNSCRKFQINNRITDYS
jgi:glutaredoxin 2